MCRAIKILCVAPDPDRLREVKRAVVAADWELCTGATDAAQAAAQLEEERPHVLVAIGSFGSILAEARERFPGMRIVADRDLVGADAVVGSLDQLRDAVRSLPRPTGPVGLDAAQ